MTYCTACGRLFENPGRRQLCQQCKGSRISQREEQVIDLVVQGRLNKEIGFALGITEGTVKEYLNRIFHKIGLTNRTELAVWALRRQQAA